MSRGRWTKYTVEICRLDLLVYVSTVAVKQRIFSLSSLLIIKKWLALTSYINGQLLASPDNPRTMLSTSEARLSRS